MSSDSPSKPGYKHTTAFSFGFLAIGTIHKVYYEQYGAKDGKPGELDMKYIK